MGPNKLKAFPQQRKLKTRWKDNTQNGRKQEQIKQLTKGYFQNIQAAHTSQNQKNKQPNQKVGKRPKHTFLQRKYTDG